MGAGVGRVGVRASVAGAGVVYGCGCGFVPAVACHAWREGAQLSSMLQAPAHPAGPTPQAQGAARKAPPPRRAPRPASPVMRVLVMCVCTPLRPSQPGPAPAPPAMVS